MSQDSIYSPLGASIQTAEIDDSAITSGKIAAGAVTLDKLSVAGVQTIVSKGTGSVTGTVATTVLTVTFAAGALGANDILDFHLVLKNSATGAGNNWTLILADGTNTVTMSGAGLAVANMIYGTNILVFPDPADTSKAYIQAFAFRTDTHVWYNEQLEAQTMIANFMSAGFTLTFQIKAGGAAETAYFEGTITRRAVN